MSFYKQINLLLVLAISLFIFSLPSKAWTVSPVRYEIEAEKGKEYTLAFSVLNENQFRSVRFQTQVKDWGLSGDNVFYTEEEKGRPDVKQSAKDWVRVSPKQFVVGPGAVKKIRFTLKIPEDLPVDGDYTTGIFVGEKTIDKKPEGETTVQIKQNAYIGVVLYITVGKKNEKVVLKGIDFKSRPVAEGLNEVSVVPTFENQGNVHSRAMIRLKLEPISYPDVDDKNASKGKKKQILPLSKIKKVLKDIELVVLRESTISYSHPLPQYLPAGSEWKIEVLADFGKKIPVLIGRKKYKVPYLEMPKPVEPKKQIIDLNKLPKEEQEKFLKKQAEYERLKKLKDKEKKKAPEKKETNEKTSEPKKVKPKFKPVALNK